MNKRLQVSTSRIYSGIIGQESGEHMLLILKMETVWASIQSIRLAID